MNDQEEFTAAPEPFKDKALDTGIWLGLAVIIAVGTFLFPAAFGRGACRGSTRSARIKWQQRQTEINSAIQSQDSKRTNDPDESANQI
jgi:hypothetical protein